MSTFFKTFLGRHPGSKYLFTEDDDEKGPDRLKGNFSRCLRDTIWRKEDFIDLAPEVSPLGSKYWPSDIGTHSNLKCPAEYAANRGAHIHINEMEIHGRWKGQKGGRVVFRYVNIQQEYEDAKVAALLCRGGVVRYKVKDTVADAVLDAWL